MSFERFGVLNDSEVRCDGCFVVCLHLIQKHFCRLLPSFAVTVAKDIETLIKICHQCPGIRTLREVTVISSVFISMK